MTHKQQEIGRFASHLELKMKGKPHQVVDHHSYATAECSPTLLIAGGVR